MANTPLIVYIIKEGDIYVAYSPELELSSYADSIERAKSNFKEVLDVYIDYTKTSVVYSPQYRTRIPLHCNHAGIAT